MQTENEKAGAVKPLVMRYLIAEYCDHPFLFCGWHLYLRESNRKQKRNRDGDWGWIRWRPWLDGKHPAHRIFEAHGITLHSDGTCDDDGVAEFARRFPMRSTVGGKPRGCMKVIIDRWNDIYPIA